MKFFIWEKEIEFDELNKQLVVDWRRISPAIRIYWDMKDIYIEKEEDRDEKQWLYFMFRWVYTSKYSEDKFNENGMRYDVTVLMPELIWDEFNKTYWHFHPVNNSGDRFQEIYEVLSGSALFLQQNNNEVKYTDAFLWDKVVMEEWFWHVTINPSDEDILVMANIVDASFDSEYGDYKELKWANHYYTTAWFIKNPNYKNDLIINESEEFFKWWDMYEQFLDEPEIFNFLH